MIKLYKWSGAGNLFMVADGRKSDVDELRVPENIQKICAENGTDGLMILDDSTDHDFKMEFYNPDGSGGMMCGNGGRCIAAFADYLGIKPAEDAHYCFEAPDGLHSAELLHTPLSEGDRWTIRLKMIDVKEVTPMLDGYFLNTGTRHFVKFVPDVETVDVATEGKDLRWRSEFAPEGTNVNFVSVQPDGLHVRTFEKGVEAETDACGTGITASAIACYYANKNSTSYNVKARKDWLKVEFQPDLTEVYLTGPAELLA